jgi:hypothetical protein
MKTHTPAEWAIFFGLEIVDNDGWRGIGGKDMYEPIDVYEFVERVNVSTVLPICQERYKLLAWFE